MLKSRFSQKNEYRVNMLVSLFYKNIDALLLFVKVCNKFVIFMTPPIQ